MSKLGFQDLPSHLSYGTLKLLQNETNLNYLLIKIKLRIYFVENDLN